MSKHAPWKVYLEIDDEYYGPWREYLESQGISTRGNNSTIGRINIETFVEAIREKMEKKVILNCKS